MAPSALHRRTDSNRPGRVSFVGDPASNGGSTARSQPNHEHGVLAARPLVLHAFSPYSLLSTGRWSNTRAGKRGRAGRRWRGTEKASARDDGRRDAVDVVA